MTRPPLSFFCFWKRLTGGLPIFCGLFFFFAGILPVTATESRNEDSPNVNGITSSFSSRELAMRLDSSSTSDDTSSDSPSQKSSKYRFNPDPENPVPACRQACYKNNLYKEVADYLMPWTLQSENSGPNYNTVAEGFKLVVHCLFQLQRQSELDGYFEKILKAHPDDFYLKYTVALKYSDLSSSAWGIVIDNKFERGQGSYPQVSAAARDRVRALQLMYEIMPLVERNDPALAASEGLAKEFEGFWMSFVRIIARSQFGGNDNALQFQILTDLKTLPDYESQDNFRRRYARTYAPVDEEGNPVFYSVPKSFDDAVSDGQRWRYVLDKAIKLENQYSFNALMELVRFLRSQFSPETLSDYRYFVGNDADSSQTETEGAWSLPSLGEEETIARLANGVRRFKLPDDQNYLLLLKKGLKKKYVAESGNAGIPARKLVEEYMSRRQYDKAAAVCKDYMKDQKDDPFYQTWKQIVGNSGEFTPLGIKTPGTETVLPYRFRNGSSVRLTAHAIKIPLFLDDIKARCKELAEEKDRSDNYQLPVIENIGRELINPETKRKTKKYLGELSAQWTVPLQPKKGHFDSVALISLPFSTPGAYLVQATMEQGNSCWTVVWINDTAIVQKQLNNQILYFVADSDSGQPLSNVNVEFFGCVRKRVRVPSNVISKLVRREDKWAYEWETKTIRKSTDRDGLATLNSEEQDYSGIDWLVTAGKPGSDHFGYYGFNNIWFANYSERYDQSNVRAFFISDRPVYRPEQRVEFKFWLAVPKYDGPEEAVWADRTIHYELMDPRGNVVVEKDVTLDAFGGFNDTFALEKGAVLGNWRIRLTDEVGKVQTDSQAGNGVNRRRQRRGRTLGNGMFRVEEYKKPEYEVTVEAPTEPVSLGDSFKLKIKAKYYFGAPVTQAKVNYTIRRTEHSSSWFPVRPWDWFYGNGYWWFGYDYDWYPGWKRWGCARPVWPWFGRGNNPPEIVAQQEVPIGPDGTVEIMVDSALAKAIYPDSDQRYSITAEVVDQSRRTITGAGEVLVGKAPFKVYTWLDRGWYEPNQQINAQFQTRRLDGKPVAGNAVVKLFKIRYDNVRDKVNGNKKDADIKPVETEVFANEIKMDAEGKAELKLTAKEPGQYRLACLVTDKEGHHEEGAYLFRIGATEKTTDDGFQFDSLELVPDKAEYAPGDKLSLMVNTDKMDSTVLLFARSIQGVAPSLPQVLRLDGKTQKVEFDVNKADMPNFFIEAMTVSNGKIYTDQKEIAVPPEKRVLNVEVVPSAEKYRPAEKAKATIRITDMQDRPVTGQVVVSIYDKSVEYISGGSNIRDIKSFFWNWKRQSNPGISHNMGGICYPFYAEEGRRFVPLGNFTGDVMGIKAGRGLMRRNAPVAMESMNADGNVTSSLSMAGASPMSDSFDQDNSMVMKAAAAPTVAAAPAVAAKPMKLREGAAETGGELVEAKVRSEFADTALWIGNLTTDENGVANIELNMPENLTTWKIRVWSVSSGTRVGEGSTEVITKKDLIIRMQKPRFLVQKDISVFSANVHNYLDTEAKVHVSLEFDNDGKQGSSPLSLVDKNESAHEITVPSGGEKRIDWKVRADFEGEAAVVMKALTNKESDAVCETIPVYVHGILKQDAVSGMIDAQEESGKTATRSFTLTVPEERRPEETKLTVRFSPTLAGAIVDALPYLAEYPYGCTEQTLNRFLPTVLLRKTLDDLGIDLASLADSHSNLNAQELGNAAERSAQWKRTNYSSDGNDSPIYDIAEVKNLTAIGVEKLTQMQCSDGGWGWFSGQGESSSPHLTALVFRGLLMAKEADVNVPQQTLQRGQDWLSQYLRKEAVQILNGKLWSDAEKKEKPYQWKTAADNLDAYVYFALTQAGVLPGEFPENPSRDTEYKLKNIASAMAFMKNELLNSRTNLSLYSLSLYGIALCKESIEKNREEIDLCIRMLSQYLRTDEENQTAWLDLGRRGNSYWWCWYGNEIETQAAYLKLLANTNPKGTIAPQLVKYLLNNRKNAVYWNSTRDTSWCIEAFVDYIKATNEFNASSKVEILVNGKVRKTVEIDAKNLFRIDNTLELSGAELFGKQEITVRRTGTGPLYYNAYLQYFTLEDSIKKSGLEVKVERRFYLLETDETATATVAGGRGQAVHQRIEKFRRVPIADLGSVKSGQLVEIELIVESKNDYESILLEDMKAAGFEPVEMRSGYNGNALGAYVEYRDERVCFFVTMLHQGRHTVTYRLRAEQPGNFSALPAKIWGMYAPELKGNADEFKVEVKE